MAVYFVTGKLGAGKSLTSVGRIREAFMRGAPVATNLDINLRFMFGRNQKKTRLYRVPDKPTLHDLECLGKGNTTYDESKMAYLFSMNAARGSTRVHGTTNHDKM